MLSAEVATGTMFITSLVWRGQESILHPSWPTAHEADALPLELSRRLVWSESSLCAKWVAKDPSFLQADSEDTDQTGRMLGAHAILLVLSWGGSGKFALVNPKVSLCSARRGEPRSI